MLRALLVRRLRSGASLIGAYQHPRPLRHGNAYLSTGQSSRGQRGDLIVLMTDSGEGSTPM
ncbi:hypothetical protein K523DRAFT_110982 [Schizophyllum commune Tattone D]|nr:hypothetical protein K523DRAFT_110982 [Schizophyllum commune Tattone D]